MAVAQQFACAHGFVSGGRSVAKILVADDNSNIQKMVGLALKDHGIDVVAVGNGEAAVRKIADVHPDLVLADVFMPVRNGYEVCKFVKEDKALSHIPVILLVGAFDPLDEQEAQRSGADGVLKKPFVPPDPLISMVKSALVRAGVAHAGFTPAKPAEPASAPEVAAPPVPTLKAEPKPFELSEESFVDELPARPAALQIESGAQPVAFGSLLGTESVDEEPAEVSTPPAAMERDWRSAKSEEGEEEEDDTSSGGSWRRDSGNSETAVEQQGVGSSRDFKRPRHEAWTPTREKEDLTAAAEATEGVTAAIPDFANRQPAAPFAGEAWAAAIESGSESKVAVVEAETPVVSAAEPKTFGGHAAEPVTDHPVAAEEAVVRQSETAQDSSPAVVAAETAPVGTPKPREASSWFSTPPNPWVIEAHKASQLASTWDAAVSAASGDASAQDVSFDAATAPDEIEVVSGIGMSSEIPAASVETVHEEAAQAVEQAEEEAHLAGGPADTAETQHDPVAHLDMDAMVAKVLARLSPSLLNDATRELLKPVVEAVIREELESRKA
jgi:CheY-like chemotaxis protein